MIVFIIFSIFSIIPLNSLTVDLIFQTAKMKYTLSIDKSKPSLYLRLVAENLKDTVAYKWDTVTALKVNNLSLHSPEAISRHLARANPEAGTLFTRF